ncbi:CMP-N-acetylneuraminate-beta-1,4-galactoside alpha-2,3-sialyltransferase isoform X3 [Meles meles]|uniref:CMP-N-acetylneuraminate-beta-1,4-galactoside alpha-2,3-sialyltransferase isoform X3 n=1 Tax=Meles meles TaxID=9662 RepID=UPI001E6A03DF|nr:CMP-N-acetylneuraminate-beta-1,4-galactoside alpha-2,3-sialyltransferase isoform X3 [Meles meles]
MGLLIFVRNLLLALCLFLVLGFLYYSAWKLHLLQWEDSNSVVLSFDSAGQTLGSEYDRLGFLLKLDSKLPAELATKYANFSEGACKPGYASALMTAIFPRFSKPAPMFLDDSFRKWARIREFVPPFGIKGQDNLIKAILSVTKEYRLTPALDRLNSAPVKGFEKDVGSKTTLRITYPEGAMQRPEQYERDSLFVLAGFKWQDFKWLKYIVYKERVSASDGFWKSVATRVPKEPPEIRILNPYFIQEAAFTLIGLPFNNGLMGRGNIPTLGSVAVTMALHGCDEVAVAGFGYDMSTPNAPLHYYETVRMAAIKEEALEPSSPLVRALFASAWPLGPFSRPSRKGRAAKSWTHNIQREKEFLRKLVKARVITDLTSGI